LNIVCFFNLPHIRRNEVENKPQIGVYPRKKHRIGSYSRNALHFDLPTEHFNRLLNELVNVLYTKRYEQRNNLLSIYH